MALFGVSKAVQDVFFGAFAALCQITVDLAFGNLIGEVSLPAPNLRSGRAFGDGDVIVVLRSRHPCSLCIGEPIQSSSTLPVALGGVLYTVDYATRRRAFAAHATQTTTPVTPGGRRP